LGVILYLHTQACFYETFPSLLSIVNLPRWNLSEKCQGKSKVN